MTFITKRRLVSLVSASTLVVLILAACSTASGDTTTVAPTPEATKRAVRGITSHGDGDVQLFANEITVTGTAPVRLRGRVRDPPAVAGRARDRIDGRRVGRFR